MQVLMEHYTPSVKELLPFQEIVCTQPNCKSIFTNMPNFEMHLRRHHKIQKEFVHARKPNLFYCPVEHCVYNVSSKAGKSFKNIKYVRQHYQKVHAEKAHVCGCCSKRFTTASQLQSHAEKTCGKVFACHECGWKYGSIEALLTHGKRKGHEIRGSPDEDGEELDCQDKAEEMKANAMQSERKRTVGVSVEQNDFEEEPKKKLKRPLVTRDAAVEAKLQQDQQTQTEELTPPKCVCAASVQTDAFIFNNEELSTISSSSFSTNDLSDIQAMLRDIETQTEVPPHFSSPVTTAATNPGFFVQMQTQTCNDFLSELELTDIQTQTNWSSLSTPEHKLQYASIATSTGYAHDEFLVSTETQTSITQCLLDSSSIVGGDDETGGGAFGGLHNTQHTQTCGALLGGLFGGQENDLIGGFQSTYTQT